MCGILAVTDSTIKEQTFLTGFNKLSNRGPDDSRYEKTDFGYLGFKRLAIMDQSDDGMQPFKIGEYSLICNGEIYSHSKIRNELNDENVFQSTSDCEVILPYYLEKGNEIFKELGSEFALVIFDYAHNEVIAARDPIGIRPLFYGYTKNKKIAFGSEVKALQDFCEEIYPFPPGHYYAKGKFVSYRDISQVDHYSSDNLNEAIGNIHHLLTEGVIKKLDADAPIGFLLSGGLDSSLVCAIAQKELKRPIRTFAIGMKKDAIDLKYARMVARHLNCQHTEFMMTTDEILSALEEVIVATETYDITTIRASVGMYLICKKIKETTDIKVLFTGEISDELFGYKYTDFAPDAEEFQKEAVKRIKELYEYDVLRADRCISENGLEGRVPFGDNEFVEYVMSIDPKLKMNHYQMGKYLLREAFKEGNYLPKTILYRDKAAFSDAVGHSLVNDLKAYADTLYTEEEFQDKIKKYSFNPPYTKESLLYRELFEKHYPGRDKLISAYWLPNQSWPGCKVNDPSARVLANYGKSGE